MSRLGLDVTTLVKLGKDARAENILARLIKEGVSIHRIIRDFGKPTGASMLLSSLERNAAIFTFRGANSQLEFDDLRDDALSEGSPSVHQRIRRWFRNDTRRRPH